MAKYVYILVFLTVSFHSLSQIDAEKAGTTPHLKEIVLGRCWNYQLKNASSKGEPLNCTSMWKAFHGAFAFKNACNLTFADYEPFFDGVVGKYIVNKSMFWSGSKKAVHDYADFDLRFTTLEDTLEGSMMNDLRWCGNPSTSDGIDYKSCPDCDLTTPFWGLASMKFAERARGVVNVMLNGTRFDDKRKPIPAYNRSSYFGKYELPSFKVPKIKLQVLVVHSINEPHRERCGTGSIQLLQQDAKGLGIKVDCVDDPDAVKHILCADSSESKECFFLSNHYPKDCGPWISATIGLAVITSLLLIATVVMAILLCRKCGSTVVY